MKTVIIYDDFGINFFVVDGDHSHLDDVYINSTDADGLQDQLSDLLYRDTGEFRNEKLTAFPVDAVKDGAKVIKSGFLP